MKPLSKRPKIHARQVADRHAAIVRLGLTPDEYMRASGLNFGERVRTAAAYARVRRDLLVRTGIEADQARRAALWDVTHAFAVTARAVTVELLRTRSPTTPKETP